MKEKLTKEMKNLPENFVVLTILLKEHYEDLNMHLLKMLVKKKNSGAYVTINKPYKTLVANMKKNKLDHSNLFFIDCITEKSDKAENCSFIKTPLSLTHIGIALDPVYKNPDQGFIFLDSLDSLLVYHKPDILTRFARSMIERIREANMAGLMIGLHEDTDPKIARELGLVCDKVIDLT